MNWSFLCLLLLIACSVPLAYKPVQSAVAGNNLSSSLITIVDEVVISAPPVENSSPEEIVKVTLGTPVFPLLPITPYTTLSCDSIFSSDDFASVCSNSAQNLIVTSKEGTNNCFVSVKERLNERLTAGVSLTGFSSDFSAMAEFQRRLKVFSVGADKSVGERAYEFPKINRETIVFVRGRFVVEVGSDVRLCSKEGVLFLARLVDLHIK